MKTQIKYNVEIEFKYTLQNAMFRIGIRSIQLYIFLYTDFFLLIVVTTYLIFIYKMFSIFLYFKQIYFLSNDIFFKDSHQEEFKFSHCLLTILNKKKISIQMYIFTYLMYSRTKEHLFICTPFIFYATKVLPHRLKWNVSSRYLF